MQTASRITKPIVAEFTPEPTPTPGSDSVNSRFELFDDPERTNTSCDYCGTIGVVETERCETAESLELPLICTDCE